MMRDSENATVVPHWVREKLSKKRIVRRSLSLIVPNPGEHSRAGYDPRSFSFGHARLEARREINRKNYSEGKAQGAAERRIGNRREALTRAPGTLKYFVLKIKTKSVT
jgi:hypothetical protein